MYASSSARPSPARVDVGWVANPAWWSASNSQSPLRSPVNIRPGRLPPWAAGAALDAVESAVRVLEDHPRFNAGRGSVLTVDGTVEMDASIMEGDRLECGAVASVTRIANPITLARRVLETRRHVLLVGPGAVEFARSSGIRECAAESTPGMPGAIMSPTLAEPRVPF